MADYSAEENQSLNEENSISEVFHDAAENVPEVNLNAPPAPPPPSPLNTIPIRTTNTASNPPPAPSPAPPPAPPLIPGVFSETKQKTSIQKLPFSPADLMAGKSKLNKISKVEYLPESHQGSVIQTSGGQGAVGKVLQIVCGDALLIAVCHSSDPAIQNKIKSIMNEAEKELSTLASRIMTSESTFSGLELSLNQTGNEAKSKFNFGHRITTPAFTATPTPAPISTRTYSAQVGNQQEEPPVKKSLNMNLIQEIENFNRNKLKPPPPKEPSK